MHQQKGQQANNIPTPVCAVFLALGTMAVAGVLFFVCAIMNSVFVLDKLVSSGSNVSKQRKIIFSNQYLVAQEPLFSM